MSGSTRALEARTARRGLWWMLAAVVAFVVMNACVKLLREDGLGTAETLFYRAAPGLPFLWLWLRRRGVSLRPYRTDLVVLRSVLGLASMATNFFALAALTMVQSQVLYLSQPVFVALLAPLLLAEPHRRSVIAALVLAGVGAFFVIAPGGALAAPPRVPALVALASALLSALSHLAVRRSSATESPELVVFYFALHAAVAGLAWGLLTGEFQLAHLSRHSLVPLLGTAVLGVLGQVLMTRAYAHAPASRIAIVTYAAIPIGLVADLLLWDAHAGASALLGAALMGLAGYLLTRSEPGPRAAADVSGPPDRDEPTAR